MTNQVAPIVTGRDLNIAARTTRSLLDRVLRQEGTTFPVSATLNLIRDSARAPSRRTLSRALATGLQVDAQEAGEIISRAAGAGLVQWSIEAPDPEDTQVELTPQGSALQQRIADAVAEVTARLWRGFDPAELEVTKRVLLEVTARAEAELAR